MEVHLPVVVLGELSVWDVATGNLLKTFTGHIDPVYSVAYSPDGQNTRQWHVGIVL